MAEQGGGNTEVAAGQAAEAPRRTGWDTLKSILFQLVIFYFVSSFFRSKSPPPQTNPDGSPSMAGRNLFEKDEKLV